MKLLAHITIAVVLACTSLASYSARNANAEPISDPATKSRIQILWQNLICRHRATDPEMAELETRLMQAQLADDPAYPKLMGQYMQLQTLRHPAMAQSLRPQIEYFVRAQELQSAIRNDVAHGQTAEAMQKKRELCLESYKRLYGQSPEAMQAAARSQAFAKPVRF
jgi:hypothetical protein